jgi:hypothetical protein
MKSNNMVEVLLIKNYSLGNTAKKELVRWLGTSLQPVLREQHDSVKKIYVEKLKDTPAIYLS